MGGEAKGQEGGRGAHRRKRRESGTRPASVGGLHAPTNWMRCKLTHVQSARQKPPASVSCRRREMTRCVP